MNKIHTPKNIRNSINISEEIITLEKSDLKYDPTYHFIALRPIGLLITYVWLELRFSFFTYKNIAKKEKKLKKQLEDILPSNMKMYINDILAMIDYMKEFSEQTYYMKFKKIIFTWNSCLLSKMIESKLDIKEKKILKINIFNKINKYDIEVFVRQCLTSNYLDSVYLFNKWYSNTEATGHWLNVMQPVCNTGMACVGKSTYDNILVNCCTELKKEGHIVFDVFLEKYSLMLEGMPGRDTNDDANLIFCLSQDAVHPLSVLDRHFILDRYIWGKIMNMFNTITLEERVSFVMKELETIPVSVFEAVENMCITFFTNSNFENARNMQIRRNDSNDVKRAMLEAYHPCQQVWYCLFAFICTKPVIDLNSPNYEETINILTRMHIWKLIINYNNMKNCFYKRPTHNSIPKDFPNVIDTLDFTCSEKLGFLK